MALLEIENLKVEFKTEDGFLTAVNGFSAVLETGRTLGIVGESGSGKSQTVLSILRLLASNGRATGRILFKNQDVLQLSSKALVRIRGNRIAMIFQDPMTCLNPYMKIGQQLMEVVLTHQSISYSQAKKKVLMLMDAVKIPDAQKRFMQYPHEFSGGMRQRVMIAMALLCKPDILIADEPTTALDVTVQAHILTLLAELQREMQMAIILITHDMGVVAGACNDVIVMYGGRIMEQGTVDQIFYRPQHPYTQGLLASIPEMSAGRKTLFVIPGNPPSLLNLPKGCPFYERCTIKQAHCLDEQPVLRTFDDHHHVACHQYDQQYDHTEERV
jgi:oligopeptide transport system ATP-binding protein